MFRLPSFVLLMMSAIASSGIALASISLHTDLADIKSLRDGNATSLEIRNMDIHSLKRSTQFPKDFAANLPVSADVQQMLDEIRRRSFEAEVVVASVEVQRSVRANEQLARSDLTVSLRGSYPNLKRVVSEVLDRFPHATATRVAIRRGSQTASADATFALALWARAQTTTGSSPDISLPKALR